MDINAVMLAMDYFCILYEYEKDLADKEILLKMIGSDVKRFEEVIKKLSERFEDLKNEERTASVTKLLKAMNKLSQ